MVTEDPSLPFDNENASDKAAAQLPPAASLSGVSFFYKGSDKPVIKDLSFVLPAGEKLFITGPSGSGKSTLLGLVAGILTPSEGEISIAGKNLKELSGPGRDRLRGDSIGYIFQEFNLVPYLSPVENVLLPLRFSKGRRERVLRDYKTVREAAEDLLGKLSIPKSDIQRSASKLSAGQRQRVAAARALIGNPSLLIADEPTSALDAEIGLVFLRLLFKECEERGSSLLFVSHDKSLSAEFARELELRGAEAGLSSESPASA
jgi:putative ABC transport system ATP-binding protein